MDKLLNCPFCGGEAERKSIKPYRKIKGRGQSYLAIIGCKRCIAQQSQAGFSTEDAWKYAENLWNKRFNTWIPVEEPPEHNCQVMIYMPRICPDDLWREKREAWYRNGKFYIPASGEEFFGITYWMPLPAGPESGVQR